mmetsp:Transcript_2986/g.10706  ORF Transcript_2986/g.10706 Transcript_2986/m.10706 type:complete len:254 (-) Transcript_2986:1639-2400(-)
MTADSMCVAMSRRRVRTVHPGTTQPTCCIGQSLSRCQSSSSAARTAPQPSLCTASPSAALHRSSPATGSGASPHFTLRFGHRLRAWASIALTVTMRVHMLHAAVRHPQDASWWPASRRSSRRPVCCGQPAKRQSTRTKPQSRFRCASRSPSLPVHVQPPPAAQAAPPEATTSWCGQRTRRLSINAIRGRDLVAVASVRCRRHTGHSGRVASALAPQLLHTVCPSAQPIGSRRVCMQIAHSSSSLTASTKRSAG